MSETLYRWVWGREAPRVCRRLVTATDPLFARRVSETELREAALIPQAGERLTSSDVPVEQIERLMDRAHAAGITGVGRALGRVVRTPDGRVLFAAMPGARRYKRRGIRFLAARDRDRRSFNACFGTTLVTEGSARRMIAMLTARTAAEDATLRDLAREVAMGSVRPPSAATATLASAEELRIPSVTGKRLLVVGMPEAPLMRKLIGANPQAIVAVVPDAAAAELVTVVGRLLAWRQMRSVSIDAIAGDTRPVLARDLGVFQLLVICTAFDELSAPEISALVEKTADMQATVIVLARGSANPPAPAQWLRALMSARGLTVETFPRSGSPSEVLIGAAPAKP